MISALQKYCEDTHQEKPETECELLYCVYNSLARCYEKTVQEIENITNKTYNRIHVVGGGCQDRFLNHLLAERTGKEVYAGPVEGTAIGNIVAQMLKAGEYKDLPEARKNIGISFDVKLVK